MEQCAAENMKAILESPSYRLAFRDPDYLGRADMRPLRLELELMKAEMLLEERGIHSTVGVFGGTRIREPAETLAAVEEARRALADAPNNAGLRRTLERAERIHAKSPTYDAARKFSEIVFHQRPKDPPGQFVIVTGGGPGIMEAGNRGAFENGDESIGLNITLPSEQFPNPYITPDLCFQFRYFAIRKMHFLMRSKALVVFPGGYGTLDELFCTLCLRQTRRMQEIPIVLFGREFWKQVLDFQFLADEGVIDDAHLDLVQYADTPEEAWAIISGFHGV